jgi:tetratricopeptide (TPR) repeat protein
VTEGQPPEDSRRPGFVPIIIVATVLLFGPVLWYDFVNFDDPIYVLDNPIVADGVTWAGVVRAFTTTQAAYWHPVTWLSHMLDVELFGFRPGPHHLVNVLLHVFNALLLYGVLVRMTGMPGRAAFVAMIFAIHPLRIESVAWVAERKDVLSTLFWMLAIWVYVEYVKKPGRGSYLTALGLFAIGLLAKPMVLTLPVVLVLLDVWPLRRITFDATTRRRVRPLILEKIPFLMLSVVAAIVTIVAQHGGGAVKSLDQFPLGHRVANAVVSYVTYLWMQVLPLNLAVFYPNVPVPAWQVAASVFALVAISWMAVRQASRHPYLAVGWAWYLVTLLPVIGLIQAGFQSLADRFLYIPHIGISIAVTWGLAELLRSTRAAALLPKVAAAAVLVYFGMSLMYIRAWRDSETVWRRALAVTNDNYVAHTNLGVALADQGRLDEGLAHSYEAVRIKPEQADAHANIGNLLARRGEYDEAISHYREAIRYWPELADAHNNLGVALGKQGDTAEAIESYRRALTFFPEFAAAHHNLGRALAATGPAEEAERHLREAVRHKPRFAEAHYSLGEFLAASGRLEEAARSFREALRIDPNHARAKSAIARITARNG